MLAVPATVGRMDKPVVRIRLVEAGDAEATRAIYNAEVTGSTVTFDLVPRTLDAQVRWIEAHAGAHPATVAVNAAGDVVGFASLTPYKERPAYATTVENSVYVRDDHHGLGVGHLLLADMLVRAADHGFHSVMARIVDGHVASIRLHERLGYQMVGVEREVGRKFNRWLDVAVMQKLL